MSDKKQDIKEKEGKQERIYVIPLREKCRVVPRYKKANKAIKTIKEFLKRHMKIRDNDLNKVKVDKYLNEYVWFKGIRKPPAYVKVKAIKEGEIVKVELAELPDYLRFKKSKEERIERKSEELGSKKKIKEEKPEVKLDKEIESKKSEESEKKASTIEAGKEFEKAAAKVAKHQTGGKTKQPKRQIRVALQK